MKFCKDCKWVKNRDNTAICQHETALSRDTSYMVWGLLATGGALCYTMRSKRKLCGAEAKLWEPKDATL